MTMEREAKLTHEKLHSSSIKPMKVSYVQPSYILLGRAIASSGRSKT